MWLRYIYAWGPLVFVFGGIILISSPFLALTALLVLVAGTVAGLAWAVVHVCRAFIRFASGHRQDRREVRHQRAAAARAYGYPYAYAGSDGLEYAAPRVPTMSDAVAVDGAASPISIREGGAS